jgi:hypothetical protein
MKNEQEKIQKIPIAPLAPILKNLNKNQNQIKLCKKL